jgi:hypothetical protein
MTTEKTAVALRVLTAINRKQEPEQRDVVLLHAYCPDHRGLPPDEIACILIEQMLRRRKARKASGDGNMDSLDQSHEA